AATALSEEGIARGGAGVLARAPRELAEQPVRRLGTEPARDRRARLRDRRGRRIAEERGRDDELAALVSGDGGVGQRLERRRPRRGFDRREMGTHVTRGQERG